MRIHYLSKCRSRVGIVSTGLALFIILGMSYAQKGSVAAGTQSTRVNIEVLPGMRSKEIDATARRVVPVAILSSLDFDASTVNPASVRLAGAPITKGRDSRFRGFVGDVNGDGRVDLVVYVSVYSLQLEAGRSEALLTASTFDGGSVIGSQQVSFTPPVVEETALATAIASPGTFSNSSPISINDSFTPPATASPYPSTISVSGQSTVGKVTVSISGYTHSFADDVDVLLVGPTGAKCLLMSDCGGSDNVVQANLTFDDSAQPLPDETQISSGTYHPTKGTCSGPGSNCVPTDFPGPAPASPYATALSTFNGTNPNGTWQLFVIDDSAGDSGSISGGWSLTFGSATSSHGTQTPGLYDPAHSGFFLRNTNDGGVADISFTFGPGGLGWIPLVGDWNGDGVETIGLYDPAHAAFFLRNSNNGGVADISFTFGPAGLGWIPLVGDWNGDGVDTIGLYDPAHAAFFLRNSNNGGVADLSFTFGPAGMGWVPLVGDWNGDGVDTIGLYDPAHGAFFLRNSNDAGIADITFTFGPVGLGWIPLAGDWNADGVDTIGLYDPAHGGFFLRNTNNGGFADLTFTYGPAGAGLTPLTGDWDGL
jgi:subtilisin-like proprotein convertase family protein